MKERSGFQGVKRDCVVGDWDDAECEGSESGQERK
jgi:hypothetical protein